MTRTTAALPPTTQRTIVSFDPQDAQNPYNWPSARKTYVLIICLVLVFNSTIGSSLSAGATAQIQEQFQITDDVLLTLIVSIYLLGYVLGPLVGLSWLQCALCGCSRADMICDKRFLLR